MGISDSNEIYKQKIKKIGNNYKVYKEPTKIEYINTTNYL